MMNYEGNLLKMRAEYENPVRYYLSLGDVEVSLNELIGQHIKLSFTGLINCIACGKKTKTSFGQGFCYNCMQTSPEAGEPVLRPELSKAHFGISRDMEWAEKHDLIDHYVYLAISGGLKVGVTRFHQAPVRWIDQGANQALIIAKTPNRHIAGIIEVFLKRFYSDKTDWRQMLKPASTEGINLMDEKVSALGKLPSELQKYAAADSEIVSIAYPVLSYPEKVNSIGFDKLADIEGKLTGIKGQYLIFGSGDVLNIRKHNGYYIRLSC